ncbi:MAG: TadE family protein [Alphaproteobacteria bacterium]
MLKNSFISTGLLRSTSRALIREEKGAVAVEMGLCSVFFVMLITGMISFGSVFFIQGNMADAARDTARRVALGQMTPVEANTFAQDRLVNWGMTYTVTATNDGTDATVQISVPMADAAIIDYLGMFSGNLRAAVTMPVES